MDVVNETKVLDKGGVLTAAYKPRFRTLTLDSGSYLVGSVDSLTFSRVRISNTKLLPTGERVALDDGLGNARWVTVFLRNPDQSEMFTAAEISQVAAMDQSVSESIVAAGMAVCAAASPVDAAVRTEAKNS
jgi:hypothetical protein